MIQYTKINHGAKKMGVTNLIFELNYFKPAIATAVTSTFSTTPNSLVIVIFDKSDTLCFSTINYCPDIHVQIRKSSIFKKCGMGRHLKFNSNSVY